MRRLIICLLAVGNHHLEYGFPSTHCTNCTSMALFLGAHVYDLHRLGSLSTTAFVTWIVVLFVYVFSIVGSRVYAGMHGFMDCSVGIILGIIGWLLQQFVMPEVEKWVLTCGWGGASSFPHAASYSLSSPSSALDHDHNLPPLSQPTPVAR